MGTYSFGNFVPTDYIKASIIVDIGSKNLMNLVVEDVDKLTIRGIAASIKGKISSIKNKKHKTERR